jgi:hypothetical protein
MNPKIILCLALVLIGDVLGCSTRARHSTSSPVGVRLTGHASWNGGGQAWPFEIVMEGFDHYYRKEWQPAQTNLGVALKTASPVIVALAIDDFYDSKDRAYVARRLWQGDKFRGVASDELREVVENGHYTEEFLAPVSREHFPKPCVIKWAELPSLIITYTIENVEFTYQRNPQFFADARKEYWADRDNHPAQEPTWHPKPSPGQVIAGDALKEAKQNPDAAIAKLREALAQFPLDQPLGAWNQSELMGALWQIRGLAEKDALVNSFYRTVPLVPHGRTSPNGDLDHGPLCFLRAIGSAKRNETPDLLAAIIADPRFDQTDAPTVVEMMVMSSEGFPLPKEIPMGAPAWPPVQMVRELGPQRRLAPMWRNSLRRHFGLPEEKLPVWSWLSPKTNAPLWGESVDDLQMACSVDASNGVLHCSVRNAGTNAIAYNDFVFGYVFYVSIEIREATGWKRVVSDNLPEGHGIFATIAADTKARWLQPGEIITNTWVRRDLLRVLQFGPGPRQAFLCEISGRDTFVMDLEEARWMWPKTILQQRSVEARVRQIFRSASPDDPSPYMHGPDLDLYSGVFTMDCGMLQLFSDPSNFGNWQ